MKAVQVVERGKAVFIDAPKPEWQPGHALVRPQKLSLCGSDIRMLHFASAESYPYPPGTTGHEVIGVVEQVDSAETDFRVGDQALVLAPGHRAMSEFYLAPLSHVLPLPEGKPIEHLLQAQQFGTVIYASQRLPNLVGKSVVVIGQGSAGLWFNFHLRRLGARRIVALDLEDFRLAHAKPFGATDCINNSKVNGREALLQINDGSLADVVIEAAGEVDAINLAVELVKPHGDILYFGYPRAQQLSFDFEQYFHKCCRAIAIVGAQSEPNQMSTRVALDVIGRGEIDVAPIITHRFPFRDVMDAYELQRTRGDGAVKILVELDQ